jgi:hypothetical protein
MTDATCAADGCEQPGRRRHLCDKHFRWYRHGDANVTMLSHGVRTSKGRRYRTTHQPDHPLASKNGNVYVHRMVLFDQIGYGPHSCYWCGLPLSWGGKTDGSLFVDHLDGYGDNNDPSNLVPSCNPCNFGRARIEWATANRAAGWWQGPGARAVLRNA